MPPLAGACGEDGLLALAATRTTGGGDGLLALAATGRVGLLALAATRRDGWLALGRHGPGIR